MEEKIVSIMNEMSEFLNITQLKKLQEVLIKTFTDKEADKTEVDSHEYLRLFLEAKRIEGCSERTLKYYETTAVHFLKSYTTYHIWEKYPNYLRKHFWKKHTFSQWILRNGRTDILPAV